MGSSPSSNQQAIEHQAPPKNCVVKSQKLCAQQMPKQFDKQSINKKSSASTSSQISSMRQIPVSRKYQRCSVIKPSSGIQKLAMIQFQRNKNRLIKACNEDNEADIQQIVSVATKKYQRQQNKLQLLMNESMRICITGDKKHLLQLIQKCGYTAKRVGIQYQQYKLSIKFAQKTSQVYGRGYKQKQIKSTGALGLPAKNSR